MRMRIHLVRKLADHLDGIDVARYEEGDTFDLPRREAELLIAERWALPVGREAAFFEPRSLEQLRRASEEIDANYFRPHQLRRAEDRMREELHDSRARTIHARA